MGWFVTSGRRLIAGGVVAMLMGTASVATGAAQAVTSLSSGAMQAVASRSMSARLVKIVLTERHAGPFLYNKRPISLSYCASDPVFDIDVRYSVHNPPAHGLRTSMVGIEGKSSGFPTLSASGPSDAYYQAGNFPHHSFSEDKLLPGVYTFELTVGTRKLLKVQIALNAKLSC